MRLAVMGLKGHHKNVLSGLPQSPDVELVAVSEDDAKNVEKLKREVPAAKGVNFYSDWKQLLEHADFDLCCLGDENGVREEQLLALAARNIHVIAEKPLTTTLAGLEKVREAFAKSKARLTMLLTMRHDPIYATFHDQIRKGAIGTPAQASSQKSYQIHVRPEWFKSRARLGGIIPYIGVHAVDLVRWTTGLEVLSVSAMHGRAGMPEIGDAENHASMLLALDHGASATVRLDYLRPMGAGSHGDDRLRVAGDKGVLESGLKDKQLLLLRGTEKPQWIATAPAGNFLVSFAAAIKEKTPARIPAQDAFRITEIVLHARDAADGGKLVALPPFRPFAGGL
ncbi:MAG TPA: Gfo/Idh/MocA family oxidoreductase [Planctomycetia bacterium]|nr:Gfo/Idh/MocA family oxidoreductase [Planctomycetia bacterium]